MDEVYRHLTQLHAEAARWLSQGLARAGTPVDDESAMRLTALGALGAVATIALILVYSVLCSLHVWWRQDRVPGLAWARPSLATPAGWRPASDEAGFNCSLVSKRDEPVLFVTAHPDDECMFFGPAILALEGAGVPVHLLCLSSGNADGLGAVRAKELVAAAGMLKVPAERVHLVDAPELPDGMRAEWKPVDVLGHIHRVVRKVRATRIVTFDDGGVSGHPNHVAISRALKEDKDLGPVTWRLHSVPLLAKYIPRSWSGDGHRTLTVAGGLPSGMSKGATLTVSGTAAGSKRTKIVWRAVSRPAQILRAQMAMSRHVSQLTWFRHLYVRFSRYMVVNELVRDGDMDRAAVQAAYRARVVRGEASE
ncbi:N-acetylglucosaminyl-phosphatidylinositol de-N-acetylase [Blastocladiella emersonii ATCC 22665]|nr:N-acetylglucosaminyl-phosphatidylinositol de-N-acetylase [Blastocladiella emersonii ATCC 22665]